MSNTNNNMQTKTSSALHDAIMEAGGKNLPPMLAPGTTSNELDLLFSPMFDELFNGSSKVVSKSSAVSAADAPNQRRQLSTPLNNHTTPARSCQTPSIAPTVISYENINQAEPQAENDQVADDEFINIFSTPVQDQGETSSLVMSADSAVTYTSVHFEARSWCISSEDPYKEDLVPAEDEAPIEAYIPEVASAPTPPLPPSFLSLWTPPLLPIPLHVPSTSHRADIPEADTPPQKRLLLTAPRLGCEVGESYVATAARQPGPTMACSVDCSFVDTTKTSRESSEFYSQHHDAQKDRAVVRVEIEVLRRERLAYEQESVQTHEALARSEAYSRALEARVAVLETQARR
nr:hypothetical protein [Tanacetum cinerariifolium]